MTRADIARELQAIEAALERFAVIREVIDEDGDVLATYRRPVRLPRTRRENATT